jgi:hypothetical protein
MVTMFTQLMLCFYCAQLRGMIPHKTVRGQLALGRLAVRWSSVNYLHEGLIVAVNLFFRPSRVSPSLMTRRSVLWFLLR